MEAYTTVETIVPPLDTKKDVRVREVGSFHVRDATRRWLVSDLPAMFGEQSLSVELHLIEAVQLTWENLEFAEKTLKD
jgi:hypothetical protein